MELQVPLLSRVPSSPISDCIVVRDSDDSSVFTVDTTITSVMVPSTASEQNSRAGSFSILNAQSVDEQTRTGSEVPGVKECTPETQPDLAIPQSTRVLRQRPERPPLPLKKPRMVKTLKSTKQDKGDGENEQPSSQTSEVIKIRDSPDIMKVQEEGAERRRSTRLSIVASELKAAAAKTSTPKREVGKRSHDVMTQGSKSANAKMGTTRSWSKKMKLDQLSSTEGESSEEEDDEDTELEEDSSEDGSSSSEEEGEEEEGKEEEELARKQKKKWTNQGLYMGQDNDFDPRRRTKRGRLSGAGAIPKKCRAILPLPMFHGLDLMNHRMDFKLPYNVFCPSPYKIHPPGWKVLSRSMYMAWNLYARDSNA